MKSLNQNNVKKQLLEIGFILKSKYFGWDKNVKVKCVSCNEFSFNLTGNLRSKGCGKACAKKRRRLKEIKRHGSLADHPFLVKEYSNINILKPEEVPCNYSTHLHWVCSSCNNKWSSRISIRLNPKNKLKKYTTCRGKCLSEAAKEENIRKSLEKYGSFKKNYPDLMKEFDYEKNIVDPDKVTRFSHQVANWKCNLGHSWPSTFANRSASENNCPKCRNFKTSRAEIRIYTELKLLFNRIFWSDRSTKKEIDILLPTYKFAIEIDGHHHLGMEKIDTKKNKFLQNLGIKVLRLRDFKLKTKISKDDFVVKTSNITIKDIQVLLKKIIKLNKISSEERINIKEYLGRNNFINDNGYRDLVNLLPGVPFERSLAKLFPKVAKQWNNKLNHPLLPNFFTPGSHHKVFWNCINCKKPYPASIMKKTQRPNSTCRDCGYIIKKRNNKLKKKML